MRDASGETNDQSGAAAEDTATLSVFYDGGCPLCRSEIAFYRRQPGADGLCWVDVHGGDDAEVAPGLRRTQALRRFHVRDADGRLVDGGRAFAVLWSALPRFSRLGRLLQRPPFAWILDRAYDLFLPVRPWLQRLAGRRSARR